MTANFIGNSISVGDVTIYIGIVVAIVIVSTIVYVVNKINKL